MGPNGEVWFIAFFFPQKGRSVSVMMVQKQQKKKKKKREKKTYRLAQKGRSRFSNSRWSWLAGAELCYRYRYYYQCRFDGMGRHLA